MSDCKKEYEAILPCDNCIHEKVCMDYGTKDTCEDFMEPVRHGKWLKFDDNGTEYQTCSECNYDMQVGCGADSWCPACGAKMDAGEGEEK